MGQTLIITGCTRGLGRALTDAAIAQGHTVAGFGRKREAIESLQTAYPEPHYFEALDVSDDAAVKRFAAETQRRFGPPERIINNAALINRAEPLWNIPDAEIAALLDVNIRGVINMLRHYLPQLHEAGRGVVVNLSSGWGRSTSPRVAPYCASKWAIEGLSKAVAQEVEGHVAVLALNPGIIDTEMLRTCFGEAAAAHETPEAWAERALPFILGLGPGDNGTSPSVP